MQQIRQGAETTGQVWGRVVDDGEVVQVLSTKRTSGLTPIGHWKSRTKEELEETVSTNGLVLLVPRDGDSGDSVEAHDAAGSLDVKIFDITKVFDRVRGALQMDKLSGKKVLIAGVGSGGSRVALELANAGVGTVLLVDNDLLEVENIARHVCGMADVGRFKTRAVRDIILNHNPNAKVICYEFDIFAETSRFEQLISEADLVIGATGSPRLNDITNSLCVKCAVPAVFAAVWEKACGGFAMRFIPGETPCYSCVHQVISGLEPRPNKSIDYSSIDDPGELKAEPGLSIDIGFIPLLQSKLAVMTLLRAENGDDMPHSLLVWLNRPEGGRPALSLLKASPKKREDCLTCGSLGMSPKT